MKKIIIAMAAIAAALTMASCNKEQPVSPNENPTVGKSVVTASIENDLTKAYFDPNGNDTDGYKIFWSEGDNLFVCVLDEEGEFIDWLAEYKLEDSSAGSPNGTFSWHTGNTFIPLNGSCQEPSFKRGTTYLAAYPFDLVDGLLNYEYLIWKTEQTYNATERYIPMYSDVTCVEDGTADFKFTNLGGMLKLTVKGSAYIRSIKISAAEDEAMSGTCFTIEDANGNMVGEISYELAEYFGGNVFNYILLDCGDDGVALTEDGTDFYISMPCKFSYDEKDNIVFDGYSNVTITLTDTEGRTCVKKLNNKNLVIERSKITTASFTASEFKANVPEGALPGKFSVSAGKQVQFSSGNLTATVDATGAPTAWKFAANQYDYLGEGGANMTIGTAAGDVDLFGWSTAATTYGINSSDSEKDYSGEFVDWGKEVGDGKTWRTLSIDEWKYMLYNRTVNGGTDEGKSFSINITFGGKTGLVLYPDDYDKEPISGTVTELPDGVVFLPTAGSRTGSEVFAVDDFGRYWSSSSLDEDFALYVSFSSDGLGPNNWVRSDGYSVRLVTDVK